MKIEVGKTYKFSVSVSYFIKWNGVFQINDENYSETFVGPRPIYLKMRTDLYTPELQKYYYDMWVENRIKYIVARVCEIKILEKSPLTKYCITVDSLDIL
jgi:hypothetical protein